MTTTQSTPHALSHHLDAYQANGRPARVPGGGMAADLWCDFTPKHTPGGDTLAAARARAEVLFAEYAKVAYVDIRESVQEFDGGMWKAGRHVERIERGDRPGPTFTVEPGGPDTWRVVGPHAYGSYMGREYAERAAARLADTSADAR